MQSVRVPTTANDVWGAMLRTLADQGERVAPRGQRCREFTGATSYWDMDRPVITVRTRKLNYRFMCAEAAWILSGDNRTSSIVPFNSKLMDFSDDTLTFRGAYGPPFRDQLPYLARVLCTDPETRQAVATIWRPRPEATRDVPCTVALQFLVREGALRLIVTMRSSDAWLGIPYDVFNFSMMGAYVLAYLRQCDPLWSDTKLGQLQINAGSQHLYERDLDGVARVSEDSSGWKYPPYDPDGVTPDDLVTHLWKLAKDGESPLPYFLSNLDELRRN